MEGNSARDDRAEGASVEGQLFNFDVEYSFTLRTRQPGNGPTDRGRVASIVRGGDCGDIGEEEDDKESKPIWKHSVRLSLLAAAWWSNTSADSGSRNHSAAAPEAPSSPSGISDALTQAQ